MTEPILSLRNYNVTLDSKPILKNINCTIPKGEITVIVGPSGAGKSTLLRSIVQLIPYDGELTYGGHSAKKQDILNLRREIVYVSQAPVYFPGTVEDNIAWGLDIWRDELDILDTTPSIPDLLTTVGLDIAILHQSASSLSGGQLQRLHLARSLAIQPKVLLLDEPASSLDAISKEKFEDLIQSLVESNSDLTVIMITHDLHQAKRIANHLILIIAGEIHLDGEVDEFFVRMEEKSDADILREYVEKEGIN